MRLIEAVMDANQRAAAGDGDARLRHAEYADSFPLVALTCIDPRLNPLIPKALGIPEEDLIWLRNAGNIIFDTMSSMMRTLALGCVVKGGREIAVIGHTDCLVAKSTAFQITERFKSLGIDRARLPENLNEFFGLFASERQNVIRGANIVRESPLIGPRVPVHGLLLDIHNGRLEWLVNGYQALDTAISSSVSTVGPTTISSPDALSDPLAAFNPGQMKFPESKIGETAIDPNQWLAQMTTVESKRSDSPQVQAIQGTPSEFERKFDRAARYKIIGSDEKVYGPISGLKVLEWMADGRIGWDSASQLEGTTEWRPLRAWGDLPKVPLPQPVIPVPRLLKSRKR